MNRSLGAGATPAEVVSLWQEWVGRPGVTSEAVEGYLDGYGRRLPARQGPAAGPYRQGHLTGLFDRLRERPLGTGIGDVAKVAEAAARPAFELRPGEPVRWRQGSGWRTGRLGEDPVAGDGSVRVLDGYTGGARSLRSELVQVKVTGPRGGRRWSWWDDAVLHRSRPCELGDCAEASSRDRVPAQWAVRSGPDDLVAACSRHASLYHAWELEPITEPAVAAALLVADRRDRADPPRPPRPARPAATAALPAHARGL